jgi:hypothetical protein
MRNHRIILAVALLVSLSLSILPSRTAYLEEATTKGILHSEVQHYVPDFTAQNRYEPGNALQTSLAVATAKYKFVNKLIDSSDNNYNYAYAPSIIYNQGTFHMFYCSSGANGAWDYIRYVWSNTGRVWSSPRIVLSVSDFQSERAACDPSVIYYDAGDGPYYYMFYSGNAINVQTAMFVARSSNIEGPYFKYTRRGTWEVNASDPKIIIAPRHPVPDGASWYGAGQQTVVEKNGTLYSWYLDDTAGYPQNQVRRIYMTATTDPTSWPTSTQTNILGPADHSSDVKYDPRIGKFVMFAVYPPHAPNATLLRRFSTDGKNWSGPETLCDVQCFPDYAHNVGVSGDRSGHLREDRALVVYGAPFDLNPAYGDSWGRWDLYGSVINAAGGTWNDVPWGWDWEGMGTQHQLALGDYDDDGRTDRAIVDRNTGKWYVIGSKTPNVTDIPWGWQWAGMTRDFDLALGKYDGDGKTDRAIVNRNTGKWYVIGSKTPNVPGIPWGWQWAGMGTQHQLALGDYDGDGKTDRAIVDSSIGAWYVIGSKTPNVTGVPGIPWGWQWAGMGTQHQLALGDYDGDGKTDRAIVDRNTGKWYVIGSKTPNVTGLPDIPWGWQWAGMTRDFDLALGKYDGDGKTDRAITNRNTGKWYVIGSKTPNVTGLPDIPWGWQWIGMGTQHQLALGDYDGDGKTDRAIVSQGEGNWYILGSEPFKIYSSP